MVFFLFTLSLFGQETKITARTFEELREEALELSLMGNYPDSKELFEQAIEKALSEGFEEKEIMASIDLAEVMRKSQNFNVGLDILDALKNSQKYPYQHVRLLDRTAALHAEGGRLPDQEKYKYILTILDSAIIMAEEYGFKSEEGVLKNQKGFHLGRLYDRKSGLPYHLEAAEIFLKLKDDHNYVGTMTKALEIYAWQYVDQVKVDSIMSILEQKLEGNEWYATESELFHLFSNYQVGIKKDSTAYFEYMGKSLRSTIHYERRIYNNKLDYFRVQQETLSFQKEADAANIALQIEESRNRTLYIILGVLGFTILSVGILFYRERLLKKEMRNINDQLKVANDKYQMLMVESNHRIKNNLQMVISMLEFASRDVDPNNKKALKRISGKIHTVSLLHKHLYADVHNENVSLKVFFNEIIQANKEMSSGNLNVTESFDEVNIRSERIIYFGLILNEMLSNTIEHCRDEIKKVNLAISRNGIGYHFNYVDNSAWGIDHKKGTGSLLIEQLVERIGGKEYQFNPSSGEFKFKFHVEG